MLADVITKSNKFEGWIAETDKYIFEFVEMMDNGIHYFKGTEKKPNKSKYRRWQNLWITKEFMDNSNEQELINFLDILMTEAMGE